MIQAKYICDKCKIEVGSRDKLVQVGLFHRYNYPTPRGIPKEYQPVQLPPWHPNPNALPNTCLELCRSCAEGLNIPKDPPVQEDSAKPTPSWEERVAAAFEEVAELLGEVLDDRYQPSE